MAMTPDPALLEELRSALEPTYALEREIGGGGMSRVFLATERALDRRVVVKVLPPELTAGVNRDRFRREIQIAARLQHPHLVPLLSAGQAGDILWYTMPFIEGETLRAHLERHGRLGAAQVVRIVHDVVDALAHAHERGLVHRDIKPENILVQGNHALVTDFGVAKAISAALPGSSATTVGVAVGTPAYMAPEQIAADPAADHRMDLYAVGLLAYELLSGASPFTDPSPQATLAKQLTHRPTPPHLDRPDVSPALSRVIMRCLEKEPAARFADARELLAALDTVPTPQPGPAPTVRLRARGMPRPQGTAGWIAAGVALLALAAGLGAVLANRGGEAVVTERDSAPSSAAATATGPPSDTTPSLLSAPPPTQALTRADSEAIAAAITRRYAEKQTAAARLDQRAFDSLRNELERALADSMRRMLGSGRQSIRAEPGPADVKATPTVSVPGFPPMARGPLRVAVGDFTDQTRGRDFAAMRKPLGDSLALHLDKLPNIEVVRLASASGSDFLKAGAAGAQVWISGAVRSGSDSGIRVVLSVRDLVDPSRSRGSYADVGDDGPFAVLEPLAMKLGPSLEATRRTQVTDVQFVRGFPGMPDSLLRAIRRTADSLRRHGRTLTEPKRFPDSP